MTVTNPGVFVCLFFGGLLMYKVCKECGKQFDLSVKKCPECGGKLKKQFTEEELEEIQKQNDDFTTINTFML